MILQLFDSHNMVGYMSNSMPLRILLPLTIVTFAVGTDTFVIAGLLPAISQELHVSPTNAGQLVTAFSITFALAAPILGAITGGLRRDTALKLGLIGFIIGNAATALAPTFGLALAARILTALGASLLTPSASTITVALTPADKRGRALAIVMGGLMSATALGVSLGLIIGQANWRHTMWALTALGAASLIAVFRWIPPVTLPAIPLRNRLQPLKDLRVLGIVATTILVVGSNMQIYVYTGLITGATGTMLIIGLTTFGVCTIIGNFVAGKLTDAYTPQLAVLVSIIGLALSQTTFNLGVYLGIMLIVLACNGFFGGMLTVPQQARIVAENPANAPLLIALLSSAVYTGFALAGAVGKIVVDAAGAGIIPWTSALMLLIPLLLTFTIKTPAAPAATGEQGD